MLGMMMDFLRDSIDPVFAKGMLTIYNSTTSVIMGIAAVVAIAQLFQENKDSENDKEEEKPLKRCAGELFLVVAIIFFCYGEYCKLHYYEVPNINFYDSYEKVENEISAPGSIADIVYDEAANQRENEDVEESDGEFKVYGINYVPGSLIYHRMGEKVDIILYVTWDKGRKPIPKAEKLDFEFDREKIQPCAEDKFKITASPFLFCSKAKYWDVDQGTQRGSSGNTCRFFERRIHFFHCPGNGNKSKRRIKQGQYPSQTAHSINIKWRLLQLQNPLKNRIQITDAGI